MKCCIFESEEDAAVYQDQAHSDWLAEHSAPAYARKTVRWAVPRQRATDQKWYVALCPLTDNSGQVVEDYDTAWEASPDLDPE